MVKHHSKKEKKACFLANLGLAVHGSGHWLLSCEMLRSLRGFGLDNL